MRSAVATVHVSLSPRGRAAHSRTHLPLLHTCRHRYLARSADRASRLLARATAAKEAGGRAINPPTATPEERTHIDMPIGGINAIARVRNRMAAKRHTAPDDADVAEDDADDGGDD